MNAFDILMVLALGSLAGTGIGLTLGFLAKKRRSSMFLRFRNETTLNLVLVLVCSVIITGCLTWISLV
jgi:hypothetical protein